MNKYLNNYIETEEIKYLEYYIWEQLSITFKLCEWMMKLLWWFWHVITYSDMFVTPEESMEKSTEADSRFQF